MSPSLSNRVVFPYLEAHSDLNHVSLGLIGLQAISKINKFWIRLPEMLYKCKK